MIKSRQMKIKERKTPMRVMGKKWRLIIIDWMRFMIAKMMRTKQNITKRSRRKMVAMGKKAG